MIPPLDLLADELLLKIIEYSDSKTKQSLLLVDKRIQALVLGTITSIGVFPTGRLLSENPPSNIPRDILVSAIRRYPNLRRIAFGPAKRPGLPRI